MTYWQFHLIFVIPPLGLLIALTWRDYRRGQALAGHLALGYGAPGTWRALAVLLLHVLIAFVYTTPWDNYLVASGVWGYGVDRVLFTVGYVPIEEYAFFVLQTLLTGLFIYFLARRFDTPHIPLEDAQRPWIRAAGAGLWLLLSALGVLALTHPQGRYFGLISIWAAPVLALQWSIGGDFIVARARLLLAATLIPTFYLWIIDLIAIRNGIWWIDPAQSSGFRPYGLPIEEAYFFLLTNLLVGFGMTLALEPAALRRLDFLRGMRWWRVLLVLWGLSMVPAPLLPEPAFIYVTYLSTGLLSLGVLGYALEHYGRLAWRLWLLAVGFGWAVEWLGKSTGFPFGSYAYTAPGPALLGVPLFVPLGWWAFSMIALAISPYKQRLWIAPLALVVWDLALDPLMVHKGFWGFNSQSIYYGIPAMNFIGWYLVGLLLIGLMLRSAPSLRREASPELRIVFVTQSFLMTVGLAFYGLHLAASVTLLVMGGVSLSLWRGNLLQSLVTSVKS